jgi:hypothetical protein
MPVIERSQLWLAKAFDHGEHCGVDKTYVSVCVAITHLADTGVIPRGEFVDGVSSRDDILEEGDEHTGMQALVNPIINLDEDR